VGRTHEHAITLVALENVPFAQSFCATIGGNSILCHIFFLSGVLVVSARKQNDHFLEHLLAPRYPVTVTVNKLRSQAAQANPTADFETLFQEHWTRVYGVIFRIVGDQDEAEDLALEAFLKLHHKLNGNGKIKAQAIGGWLYRVATNLGLNALRSRKRRERYELEAGKISLEAAHPKNPAVEVERAEERRRVQQVLVKMRSRAAKILVLRHSGLSYAEIATAVRVSPNSVGKLLSRAEKEFERRYRALEGR
jgi:RNA polymerase sigma-70 factor (ECF subfamily)